MIEQLETLMHLMTHHQKNKKMQEGKTDSVERRNSVTIGAGHFHDAPLGGAVERSAARRRRGPSGRAGPASQTPPRGGVRALGGSGPR